MPHDLKNQLIEVGDFVKVDPNEDGKNVVGRVSKVYPDTDTCNVFICWPEYFGIATAVATAAECELVAKGR